MVEFPEDIWCKIKSFRPVTTINIVNIGSLLLVKPIKANSFIIKDVVLKFISTKADCFNILRIWFVFKDDIIHSKTFLEFQQISNVIMENNDILIVVSNVYLLDFKLKNTSYINVIY